MINMKIWLALILSTILVACATNPSSVKTTSESNPPGISKNSDKEIPSYSKQLVKSPYGYVINGSKEIFGGFIGDCATYENFPYYWECQAENGGEGFH